MWYNTINQIDKAQESNFYLCYYLFLEVVKIELRPFYYKYNNEIYRLLEVVQIKDRLYAKTIRDNMVVYVELGLFSIKYKRVGEV